MIQRAIKEGGLRFNDNRYLVKGLTEGEQTVEGDVVFDGDVTINGTLSPNFWNRNGGTLSPRTLTDSLGIGVATASAALHVFKTTEQLRLSYSADFYSRFIVVNATGVLTINPCKITTVCCAPVLSDAALVLDASTVTINHNLITASLTGVLIGNGAGAVGVGTGIWTRVMLWGADNIPVGSGSLTFVNPLLTVNNSILITDTSAGDAILSFLADSQNYTMGVDNSDGNVLWITPSNSLNSTLGMSMNTLGQVGFGTSMNGWTNTQMVCHHMVTNIHGDNTAFYFARETSTATGTHSINAFFAQAEGFVSNGYTNNGTINGCLMYALARNVGTLNQVVGLDCTFGKSSGAGNLTNAYGLIIRPYDFAGTTTTNGYGIFISAPTSAGTWTNAYPIYSTWNSQSFFVGGITILSDVNYMKFGAGSDAGIRYDGTNMQFDSRLVGTGNFIFNNGNVGIGGTPATALHVFGQELRVTSDAATVSFYGADNAVNGYVKNVDTASMDIMNKQNTAMQFYTNDALRMTLAATGYLGIGGTPTVPLHVFSTALNNTILEDSNAGVSSGPLLTLYRNSASPAVNDYIGSVLFSGKNSGAAVQVYGEIAVGLVNVTAGAVSSNFEFYAQHAGAAVMVCKMIGSMPGISCTVTTASLVGKTITFLNGLITGFA